MIERRLAELGLVLPDAPSPAGLFAPTRRTGDLLFVGGHGPGTRADGTPIVGKVGRDLQLEEAREAARLTALRLLATIRAAVGDLERVRAVVKVLGMVNAAPGFDRLGGVMDGCSQVLIDVFGPEVGGHARSAVGVAELPQGIPVEIELIAEIRPA